MLFVEPTLDMIKHRKLFVEDNGKLFNWVFIDVRFVLNVTPLLTLKSLGKNMEDLIPTNMKMDRFMSQTSNAFVFLVVMLWEDRKMYDMPFMIDGKPSYSVILGKYYIHINQCVCIIYPS